MYALLIVLIILILIWYTQRAETYVNGTDLANYLVEQGWTIQVTRGCSLCLWQLRQFYPEAQEDLYDYLDNKLFKIADVTTPVWINKKHGIKLAGPFSAEQISQLLNVKFNKPLITDQNELEHRLYQQGWRFNFKWEHPLAREQMKTIWGKVPSPYEDHPILSEITADNEMLMPHYSVQYPYWSNIYVKGYQKGIMTRSELEKLSVKDMSHLPKTVELGISKTHVFDNL